MTDKVVRVEKTNRGENVDRGRLRAKDRRRASLSSTQGLAMRQDLGIAGR